MLRLVTTLVSALLSGLRSRRDLVLENLALRQQLATVLQKHPPRIRPADRWFWVLLRRLWSKWASTLVIVKPKTVVAWHRAGFAIYRKWLSGSGRPPGRPSVDRQIRHLVRRMASENGWGAPRIHGELLKLGFQVSERTVSRYLRRREPRPERRQSWLTFLGLRGSQWVFYQKLRSFRAGPSRSVSLFRRERVRVRRVEVCDFNLIRESE